MNPLTSMMPVFERLFRLRRRVLDPDEAVPVAALAGMEGAAVARMDGVAEGQPFVIFLVTAMPDSQKKLV